MPWGRWLVQVAELVGGHVADLLTSFPLLEESISAGTYFREIRRKLLARHDFEVGNVWLPPMFWALCLGDIVGIGNVLLRGILSEPGLLGSHFELVPVLDPQRLWFCRVPFCLVLWGIDVLYGDVGTATTEREWAFEAPMTTVGITAVCGVDLADAGVERGELGVLEECPKRRTSQR